MKYFDEKLKEIDYRFMSEFTKQFLNNLEKGKHKKWSVKSVECLTDVKDDLKKDSIRTKSSDDGLATGLAIGIGMGLFH